MRLCDNCKRAPGEEGEGWGLRAQEVGPDRGSQRDPLHQHLDLCAHPMIGPTTDGCYHALANADLRTFAQRWRSLEIMQSRGDRHRHEDVETLSPHASTSYYAIHFDRSHPDLARQFHFAMQTDSLLDEMHAAHVQAHRPPDPGRVTH